MDTFSSIFQIIAHMKNDKGTMTNYKKIAGVFVPAHGLFVLLLATGLIEPKP